MEIFWEAQTRSLGSLTEHQHPRQHWIVDPFAQQDEPRAAVEDQVLPYIFTFDSVESFKTFKDKFSEASSPIPTYDEWSGIVLFPVVEEEQFANETVRIVGFARFGLIEAMLEALQSLGDGNTLYTIGMPIAAELAFAPFPPPPDFGDYVGPVHVVIDTEIAFANARFVAPAGGTRIKTFWDMGAAKIDPVNPTFIGRYLDAAAIDALANMFRQDGNVDEWALYAHYDAMANGPGSIQRLPAASGHGTHVLDLFTGGPSISWNFDADIPIVAVMLPQRAVDATHGAFLYPYVWAVFHWISTWDLDAVSPQVNYSFGGHAGPHDGKSAMEVLFDEAVDSGLVSAVSVPAGNSFDSQTHAAYTGNDLAAPQTLEWNIQPDDGTASFLQIWLPECRTGMAEPNIQLTLATPFGLSKTFKDNEAGVRDLRLNGEVLARVYMLCQAGPLGTPVRSVFLVAVRHTAQQPSGLYLLDGYPDLAGAWTVRLEANALNPDQRVELWIERDDVLPRTRTGARQSYFTAPRPVWPEIPPDDPTVTNAGTISDIATGQRTIVAAASVRSTLQPSSYSSEGFVAPFRHPPTVAAIADDSPVHLGVLAAGTFSGSVTAMAGTSAASAVAARVAAGMVNDGLIPSVNAVRAFAASQDNRPFPDSAPIDPVFGVYEDGPPPRSRVGWGCLKTAWTRMPRIET